MYKNNKKMLSLILGAVSLFSLKAEAGSYVVGVENLDYLPHYSSEGGEYKGYGRDLLDAFAKDAGHTFTYKPLPVKRLYKAFAEGQIDLKYPDNSYWSDDSKKGVNITYSAPVVNYIDGVVVKPEDIGKGKGRIKTLGTVRGFTPWEYIKDIESGAITLSENGNFKALITQVSNNRIDAAYANIDVIKYNLDGKPTVLFDKDLPHTKSAYHLSTIKHGDVLKEFDAWLSSNADKVAQIKAKHRLK